MEVVAIVQLGRTPEQEAPVLAAELGLTAYEVGVMLRAPTPIIVLRSDDRGRILDILGRLRSRGHDAVGCDLEQVVPSDQMFCPKHFRIEAGDLVGIDHNEERRLPFADLFALVRAVHTTKNEDTSTVKTRELNIGRAAMSGGVVMTKTSERSITRVTEERQPVLYAFRGDGAAWLLNSQTLLYEGLGPMMQRSKAENFEVLLRVLREQAPQAPYDARLLQVRLGSHKIMSLSSTHLATSTAAQIDILAHIVAIAINRGARPYR